MVKAYHEIIGDEGKKVGLWPTQPPRRAARFFAEGTGARCPPH